MITQGLFYMLRQTHVGAKRVDGEFPISDG
jgi:hypothetical protein